MKLIRLFICLFGVWFWTNPAAADPYEKGLDAYKDGSFSKAYKMLDKASKKTSDKFDKASMLVLMGASAVKMGKNSKAKTAFIKALKLDPDVQLPSVAMRDRKVKKVFESALKSGDREEEQDELFSKDSDDFGADTGRSKKKRSRDKNFDERESRSKKSRAEPAQSDLTHFLPFGINGIMRDRLVPGIVTGGLQGAALFSIFYFNQKADDADADAKNAYETAAAQNALGDPKLVEFLSENESYVKQQRMYGTLALIGLPLAYVISVAESYTEILGSAPPPPRSRRSRSRSEFSDSDSFASENRSTLHGPLRWTYDFGFVPASNPALYLELKTSF